MPFVCSDFIRQTSRVAPGWRLLLSVQDRGEMWRECGMRRVRIRVMALMQRKEIFV